MQSDKKMKPIAGERIQHPFYGAAVWRTYNGLSNGQKTQAKTMANKKFPNLESRLFLVTEATGRVSIIN